MAAVKMREVKILSKLPAQSVYIYISRAKLTVIWQAYLRKGSCQLTNRNANILLGNLRDPILKENIWEDKIPGGVFSIIAYTGTLRPKAVPFSGFRYMKGYWLVEVCERAGKSLISMVQRPERAKRCILWLWESEEKCSELMINSCLKESAFTALKGVNRIYRNVVPFLSKMV